MLYNALEMKYTKQQNRKNVSEFIVLRTQSNSYVVICGWKNKINPKIIKKKITSHNALQQCDIEYRFYFFNQINLNSKNKF